MLCRYFSFFFTISFFLVMPGFTANAQIGDARSFVGNPVRKAVPSSRDRSTEIEIQSQIAKLQSLLRNKPGNAVLLNNLATKFVHLGRLDEALGYMQQSVASDNTIATTHLNLGGLYDRLGRYDEARRSVARAAQLDPKNSRMRSYLCELNLLTEKNSEAVKCYRGYFSEFEATPTFRANFGVALMSAGELQESIAVLEKVAAELPRDSATQNALAVALYAAKDYKAAIKILKNAVENDPLRSELRLNLGYCYLAAGNRPGALSQYNLLKASNSGEAKLLYNYIYRNYVLDARELTKNRK